MTLTGKGYFVWKVRYCENGDPDRIAALAQEANLSHVLIKIADGAFPYNIDLDNGYDFARPAIKKLQARNIAVWGWQYVYGDYPDQEAEIAVSRALDLGVQGFVVNAEGQYSNPKKAPAASRYMNILRNHLGSLPIALSSYRYPSYHPNLPWVNFLDRCDYNMPQVYWMQSHNNAGAQLRQSVKEFRNLRPYRPIIATGPTFKEHGWMPTKDEVIEFMKVAKELEIPAVNFWFWEGVRRDMPEYWNLVRDYPYEPQKQEEATLPEKYIRAMNTKDPDKVLNFYAENAVHIRPDAAVQGKQAIRKSIDTQMQNLSKAGITLVNQSKMKKIYHFVWEGTNKYGTSIQGRDTVGLVDQRISYHYSFTRQI
mgnify:FL=1